MGNGVGSGLIAGDAGGGKQGGDRSAGVRGDDLVERRCGADPRRGTHVADSSLEGIVAGGCDLEVKTVGTIDRFKVEQGAVVVYGSEGAGEGAVSATGYDAGECPGSQTGGVVIGYDAPVSQTIRGGIGFTYAKSDITGNSSVAPNWADVDTFELVSYASQNIDPTTDLNYQFDIGQNQAKSRRQIGFAGTTASANFNSLSMHGSAGIGRVYALAGNSNVTPSVRLDYTEMHTDGYTETGAGPLNLQVADSTYKEFLLTFDGKLAHQLDHTLKLIANASVGYDFLNKKAQTTSTFTGGGPAFVTYGLEASPWVYRAGLGLIKDDKKGTEYSLRYDLETRSSGYLNQTASAKVRWAF